MRCIGYLDNSRNRIPKFLTYTLKSILVLHAIICSPNASNASRPIDAPKPETLILQTNHSASPSLFKPTISYSPPPSLPLPLPLPLPNPCSSSPPAPPSTDCALALPSPVAAPAEAAPPPKLIGLSSLHLQLHTPRPVMNAALQNCRIHHRALVGMECEYSDTTIR
jgi:hypothetical protein